MFDQATHTDDTLPTDAFFDDFKASRVKRTNLQTLFPDAPAADGWSYNTPGPDTGDGWCYPGSPGWITTNECGLYVTSASSDKVYVHLTNAEYELFLALADE